MRGKIIALIVIVLALVMLDQVVDVALRPYPEGSVVASILGGLIDIRIVHNTGAAWGIFSGHPEALALFSIIMCLVLLAYFFWTLKSMSVLQMVGIACIIGGGVANALDRFTQGYVLDYFSTTFMDFPVFNIPDIGVTCGVAILLFGMLLDYWHTKPETPDSVPTDFSK